MHSSPPEILAPPWAAYRVGRGEQGVLTFEPYKSALLPLWRFKTPEIARESSQKLWSKFLQYEADEDFVGMDMARKFLQMGMTRAKRYANHKGGRKYGSGGKAGGKVIEVGENEDWEGRKEKEEASAIFRNVWEKARESKGYVEMKGEFLRKQREWDRVQKQRGETENGKGKRKREGETMA